jgi:hypothetical protein
MNFDRDTFESVARRKKLAGMLSTLRGPPKPALDMQASCLANRVRQDWESSVGAQQGLEQRWMRALQTGRWE